MSSIRLSANFSRPADATAYATGDAIANSGTASSVVPLTFALPENLRTGCLYGARCTVTPASGNVVITALDFDLLVFRAATDIPFAAGSYIADNAQMSIAAAAQRELVGVFHFDNAAWRNPLGALTAGASGWQGAAPSTRARYCFDVGSGSTANLIAVVQVMAAWTPLAVVNRFDFELDCES